jgi:SPP1 family predicted phage head-tail adaptor
MQLGDLNRRIVIEQPTTTKADDGQEIPSWSTLSEVWAKVSFEKGGEAMEADQLVARRIIKFWIRYREVDETMRILFDGGYFNIRHIERIGRSKYLILKADYADRGF